MQTINALDQISQRKAHLNGLGLAHPRFERVPKHSRHLVMIMHSNTIIRLQAGNTIFPEPFRHHGMEKYIVFLPNYDVANRTALLPVNILQPKQILMMKLNYLPEIELWDYERPALL